MERTTAKFDCVIKVAIITITMCAVSCSVMEPARHEREKGELAGTEKYSSAIQSLESEDRELRERAAIKLLVMDTPEAREAVRERIGEEYEDEIRVDMIRAVSFVVDHGCYEAILEALEASDKRVREAAASALSRFGEAEEVNALIEKYREVQEGEGTRELVIEAIGRGVFYDGIPVLLQALRSEDRDERESARRALRLISGHDFDGRAQHWEEWWKASKHRNREDFLADRVWVLHHDLKAAQKRANELDSEIEYLSSLITKDEGKESQSLLDALNSPYKRVQEYAAYRLRQLGEEGLKDISLDERRIYKVFHKALTTGPAVVRQDVVDLIVRMEGKYRNPLIVEALTDDDSGVLVTAIDGIGGDVSETIEDHLIASLEKGNADVRESAANALGRADSRAAVPALMKALDDPEENVRWFAVESLRKLEAETAVPKICELVEEDSSARVREIAATALGEFGQPGAVPSLRKALEDENERVRKRASASLKTLGLTSFDRAQVVAEALDEHGFWEEAVSLLREAIEEAKKEDEDVSDDQMGGARLKLAGLLKRAGQYTEAAEIYEEYAEEHGAESDARLSLVECWIKGGEPERVEEQIAEWLDVRSDDALSEALDLGIEVVRILRKEQEDLADQIARKLLEEAHEVDDEEVIEKLGEMGWEQEEVSEESETEDNVEGDEDSAEGDEGAEEEAESSETGEK